jgi:hypothetical protein
MRSKNGGSMRESVSTALEGRLPRAITFPAYLCLTWALAFVPATAGQAERALPKAAGIGPTLQIPSGYHLSRRVRGGHAAEGRLVQMTQQIDVKRSNAGVDASSDTFDTIAWLVKNIPRNSGCAGLMARRSIPERRKVAAESWSCRRSPLRISL